MSHLATPDLNTSDQQKMGKYLLKKVLGKGAMGIVYLAYDPDICRPVAIKTLHGEILSTDEGGDFLTRFKTEAQAVGRLTHQNIVAIYDFDLQHIPPYFVMEYCPGLELKKLLANKGKFELNEALDIANQILEALSYSHQMGIIHRDIKPANVFVQENGRVKLADFGIAHLDSSELTRMGMVLGTPSYMSPEQAQAHEVDARSDLFSTAVVLYEMLTGRKAFKGDNPAATLHQVVHRQPPHLSKLDPSLPLGLSQVLEKALAKKASQRYESASSFQEALSLAVEVKPPKGNPLLPMFKMALGALLALGLVAMIGLFQSRLDAPLPPVDSETGEKSLNLSAGYPYNILPIASAPVHISEQEQRRIQRLVEVADAHLMVNRLVSPQGSNAYDTYVLVLGRDPRNESAIEGLKRVAQAYVAQCDELLRQGFVEDVMHRLEAGKTFFPGYPPLMERLQTIRAHQD